MLQPFFKSAESLAEKANAYFSYIEGEYQLEKTSGKEQKIWEREPEPATISGLTLHLGFNSRKEFGDYEQSGEFAHILKLGRLQIEAVYEKKLHQQSASGAIFALKNLGWNEKADDKATTGNNIKTLTIEIIESGPKPASTEKEVVI